MFHFTKQERIVLVVLAISLLTGTIVQYALKKNPKLTRMVNLLDYKVYYKINVNTAAKEDLERIPYIGPKTAERILQYRRAHIRIDHIDEIATIPGIRKENYRIFSPHLKVGP